MLDKLQTLAKKFSLYHSDSAWKNRVYKFIPNHVNAKTLLAIFSVLSIRKISVNIITQHYQKNAKGWEEYLRLHGNDDYIEHQKDMTALYYGQNKEKKDYPAAYNACEVIAAYNALLHLNNGKATVRFPALLSIFENRGICAKGAFGTSPKALYLYFKKKNYATEMLLGRKIIKTNLDRMQNNYSTYILTAYNDRNNLNAQIHTVSITAKTIDDKIKYTMHNANNGTAYTSLADAVADFNYGKGKPISVIGVR